MRSRTIRHIGAALPASAACVRVIAPPQNLRENKCHYEQKDPCDRVDLRQRQARESYRQDGHDDEALVHIDDAGRPLSGPI
jgi:hypothetical protein